LTDGTTCVGANNSYLVKRKQAGGLQFSRDPLNLLNKHSRKYEGYANDKAIGIQADDNTVALTTKVRSTLLAESFASILMRLDFADPLPHQQALQILPTLFLLRLDSFPEALPQRRQFHRQEGLP
jgi:hypothetical protein